MSVEISSLGVQLRAFQWNSTFKSNTANVSRALLLVFSDVEKCIGSILNTGIRKEKSKRFYHHPSNFLTTRDIGRKVKMADVFIFTVAMMFKPSAKLMHPLGIVEEPKWTASFGKRSEKEHSYLWYQQHYTADSQPLQTRPLGHNEQQNRTSPHHYRQIRPRHPSPTWPARSNHHPSLHLDLSSYAFETRMIKVSAVRTDRWRQ